VEEVTISPINGDEHTQVYRPRVPVLLDASYGPSPRATAFCLCLENFGTGIEGSAAIKLSMESASLWKQALQPPTRGELMTEIGERATSSIAGFSIQNLGPQEMVELKVYSHSPGPFNVEMFCESTPSRKVPNLFDVSFGSVEVRPQAPRRPEFTKEHYPFD